MIVYVFRITLENINLYKRSFTYNELYVIISAFDWTWTKISNNNNSTEDQIIDNNENGYHPIG